MMTKLCIAGGLVLMMSGSALAQAELKTYADADGNIDVQKLTCAQLAGTFQEDADFRVRFNVVGSKLVIRQSQEFDTWRR